MFTAQIGDAVPAAEQNFPVANDENCRAGSVAGTQRRENGVDLAGGNLGGDTPTKASDGYEQRGCKSRLQVSLELIEASSAKGPWSPGRLVRRGSATTLDVQPHNSQPVNSCRAQGGPFDCAQGRL